MFCITTEGKFEYFSSLCTSVLFLYCLSVTGPDRDTVLTDSEITRPPKGVLVALVIAF